MVTKIILKILLFENIFFTDFISFSFLSSWQKDKAASLLTQMWVRYLYFVENLEEIITGLCSEMKLEAKIFTFWIFKFFKITLAILLSELSHNISPRSSFWYALLSYVKVKGRGKENCSPGKFLTSFKFLSKITKLLFSFKNTRECLLGVTNPLYASISKCKKKKKDKFGYL